MSNSVYQINKGINKPIEFKGLKAQYIWYLGGGLVALLILFAIIYIVDFILFSKWDRFSRNAGNAYQMINTLRKLGAEPQAIEQPLDLAVPENKLLLAVYLATQEVENDRRALNVLMGMRKAKKEGRYMGPAPI